MNVEMLKDMIVGADAVVAGAEMYPAEALACAPGLKAIARFGVGTDNIDLDYCKAHGVKVARSANFNSVAEYALTLMLCLIKNVIAFDASARRAGWDRYTMRELTGKNVGLVGFGRIGGRLAKLIKAFDANVMVYDPFVNVQLAKSMGLTICASLPEMLKKSDIVSLHLPLNSETRHLFDASAFAMMKDGAYLINTARGPIVDEDALYDALTSGTLAGAAIDVFEEEPLSPNNKLISLPNVVVSPHASALSYETNYNGSLICAKAIIDIMNGRTPEYPVI